MAKSRNYVITRNILDGEDIDQVIASFKDKFEAWPALRYLVFQHEKVERDHLQGYIELRTPQRYAAIQKACGVHHLHIETRKRTRDQARNYCMKEESRVAGPWEIGEWQEKGAGNRTDIDELIEVCKRTYSLTAAARAVPHLVLRYPRGAALICAAFRPHRTTPPMVYLLWGATGCGKTRFVYDMYGYDGLHRKAPQSKWYDGYERQPVLLLDDFSGASSKLALDYTLHILDRYPFAVEIKGSVIELLATKIFVTTNIHPKDWYQWYGRELQYDALCRRFDSGGVILFDENSNPYLADPDLFFHSYNLLSAPEQYAQPNVMKLLVDCEF